MSDSSSILDEYMTEAEFAKEHSLCQRTVSRYRHKPDGIPFAQFGGRIYVHVPGAKKWLERRTRQLNPRRSAA